MDRMLGEVDRNRRNFCKTAFAGAIGCFALAQGYARAAIVHPDHSNLPPYGNSTLPAGIRSRIVNNINGLAMHVLEAGFEPKGRPCVLLLHGFPELAYSWRRIMLPLAAAGYYVVAPDQRGYGRTTGWNDEMMATSIHFAFRTWSGTRWGSSRHSAIAPSRPWSDTTGARRSRRIAEC